MREILFRGKRTDNGEWVEGYYVAIENPLSEDGRPVKYMICNGTNVFNYEVDNETVGQYTGLCDKNGNMIFEGDVCSKFSNYSGKRIVFPVVFELGLFYAKYSETSGMPLCDICEKIEIIGNVHDNPELLKGGVE